MTSSWRVTAGNSGVPRAGGHGERGGLTGGCRCLPMLLCPCADPALQLVRIAPRGLQRSTPGRASRAREKTSGWHPPPPPGNGAVSLWSDLTSSRASVSGTRRLPLLPLLLLPPLPLPLLGGRSARRAVSGAEPRRPVRAEGRGGDASPGGGPWPGGKGPPEEKARSGAGKGCWGPAAFPGEGCVPPRGRAGSPFRPPWERSPRVPCPGSPQPCPGAGAGGCPDS